MKTTPTRSFLLALALAAVALPSFAAEPVNIARLQTTTIKSYKVDGTEGGDFFWQYPMKNLVDGNLSSGTAPLTAKYVVLDFASSYFVTTIDVTKLYRYKYSIFYSPSSTGDDWIQVPYALNVCRNGTKKWGLDTIASRIKFVFEENGTKNPDITEVQVWGVSASGMTCQHSNLSAWTEVPGSATCTKVALEQATCSACGEVFTRESGSLPLGHDYKANVVKPGKGWFSCNRCNERVDFSSGNVDLISLGGMSYDKTKVQFTAVSTSTHRNDETYGANRDDVIVDGDLSTVFGPSARGATEWYVEIAFETPVLMTSIDLTLSGSGSLPDTVRITKLENAQETEIYKQVHRVSSSTPTVSIPFSETEVEGIRIYLSNTWNDYSNVSEVRVYGTIPGAVNYTPALILMQ